MNKFKVGDKVVGNELANQYGITVEGWIGIVSTTDGDGMIWVKASDSTGTVYHVNANCFDLCPSVVNPNPVKVSKQELLDVLSAQNDCYYSLAQVVDMIKNLEDPKPTMTDKVSVLEEDFDDVLGEIYNAVEGDISDSSRSAYIDLDSAEFYLDGNRIILEDVDVESNTIAEMVREKVKEVLSKYVTVIEKSETLEA